MKKIFIKLCMYFCLFMLLGSLFTIPQMISVSKSSAQTIAIFVPLFIFGFGFIKSYHYAKINGYLEKKKVKKDTLINHQANQTIFDNRNEEVSPTIETTDYDKSLERFIQHKIENDQKIIDETLDLINNSKNIETVLSRIQFGYDKGFINSKDDFQINGIKRCYQILLDKPTPKNKTKSIEKYITQVNEHKNEFSSQVNQFLETFIQSQENLIKVEIKHNLPDLPFDEEYLNTILEDGKTIREHMQEDFKNALNNIEDDTDLDEEDEYIELFLQLNADDYVKKLENKMIINLEKELLHPDQVIKIYENGIAAYYELKKYCFSFGKYGKKYFQEMWQHLHNSKEKDFDFVDSLKSYLEDYKNNYDKYLKEYNKTAELLKRVSNPLEENIKRHYDPDAWYIRIGNRVNIYANDTNTYISLAGQKCIEFEETLLEYANDFKDSLCPYCKEKIELPKQRKNCPLCKRKIYIVGGGIKQGMMALKEEDKIKLYQLRKDFKIDKKYNPNYGHGIVVEDSTNIIENTKKEP